MTTKTTEFDATINGAQGLLGFLQDVRGFCTGRGCRFEDVAVQSDGEGWFTEAALIRDDLSDGSTAYSVRLT